MNVAAIGVGGAGGRLLNRLSGQHGIGAGSPIASAIAVDTDRESLAELGNVPAQHRHVVGQFETDGEGTEGDRELAGSVVADQQMELRRTVEDGIDTTVDAILLLAGLGGGTGSAVTPSIAADLRDVYRQPVYAVSVLPAESETETGTRANTAAALSELDDTTETQIVLDNDAWLWGSRTLDSHRSVIDREFVSRIGELLTLGQADDGAAVGERVVDASDLMGTLSGGGLATVGYARTPLSKWRSDESVLGSLKRRVSGDQTDGHRRGEAITKTLAWATRGTLTYECPRDSARRGLVAFSGPPEWLRGDAITRGRDWLVERTGAAELRSGDAPASDASSIRVLVVLAGITGTRRIQAFQS